MREKGLRHLHNEELRNYNISPSINIIMKSKRMRLASHVAGGDKILARKPKETSGIPIVGEWIILKWILER
jgi:hypothetical protein